MALSSAKAYKAIFQFVEKRSPKEILARKQGYQKPDKVQVKGSQRSYDVDAMAIYDDSADVFAIEPDLKKTTITERIGRWIFLSILARERKGKFYLVTDEKIKEKVQELLDSKQIRAEVIAVKA